MSSDQDTINAQLDLLAVHRRTLAVYLRQQAQLGVLAPPGIVNGIAEAQSAIRHIKEQLRVDGVPVEDEPNDEVQPTAVAAPSRLSPQEQRNRGRMLDKVEAFWVKGVLEQSLYQVARIELGLEFDPDAVVHAWESVVQRPNQPNQAIPAGKSIVAVFDDLLGEMLILGAPGAGKTTVLLELARDLIARARSNQQHPIPVVFNLSTWATKRQPLKEWLAVELNQRYDVPKKLAQEWVTANAVLPLLDGLDEVAAEHRDVCVEAINDYRKACGFVTLAVCSRIADYEMLSAKLRLQGAVVIHPLTKPQVDDYLKQVDRPLAAVRTALRADAALGQMLDTPLMLSIVALAYKDKSPAKLPATASPAEQRRQLFDDYCAAMFQRRSKDTRYRREQTTHWLSWLAGQMVRHNLTALYIERMQPSWLPRKGRRWFPICAGLLSALVGGLVVAVVGGLLGGLVGGLEVVRFGVLGGGLEGVLAGGLLGLLAGGLLGLLAGGLLGGLVSGLSSSLAEIRPVETLHWSWTAAGGGWRSSLIFGLTFGLVVGVAAEPAVGLLFGLGFGLVGWVLGWLVGELTEGQIAKRMIVGNLQFRQLVCYILGFGLVGALVGRLAFKLSSGVASGMGGGLVGALVFTLATRDILTRTVDSKSIRRAAWGALVSGLLGGLGFGLAGGPGFGLVGGLSGTTFGWLASWLSRGPRSQQVILQNKALRRFARNTLSGGLVGALVGGLVTGLGRELLYGLINALVFGLAIGMVGGLLSGLIEGDITTRTVPNEGIRRSIRSAVVSGLVGVLVFGLGFGLAIGLAAGLDNGLVGGLGFGLGAGLVAGPIFGLLYGGATVLQHYTLRWMISRNGSLPFRDLVPFLDYCAERIFLRKVGGGYIFVHRLLMEHFASLYSEQSHKA